MAFPKRLDDRLTLLVDVDWTGWSRLKQVTLNFGNPLQPTQSLLFNWNDSMRFAVGGIYHFSDDTDLRAGFSYDQSAVSDAARSADLPDSDAMMFSAGLMHHFNDRFSATISYSHGHYAAAPVNLSMPAAGTLIGTFQPPQLASGSNLAESRRETDVPRGANSCSSHAGFCRRLELGPEYVLRQARPAFHVTAVKSHSSRQARA